MRPAVMPKGGLAASRDAPPTTGRSHKHPCYPFQNAWRMLDKRDPHNDHGPPQATVKLLAGTHLGFTYKDVSAWSLRTAGAMALLCSIVDNDIINLIGRCRSDEVLRYLHVQAEPIMRNLSKLMISHGNYNLLPHNEVPIY